MANTRLEKVRAALAERNLDAVLVYKPENRAYLSGFTGTAGWLLITPAKAWLITDFRYAEQAATQAPAFEVIKPESTVAALLATLCEQHQINRLGIEGDYVTVDDYSAYEQALGERDLVSIAGTIETLRMIKDEAELTLMRRAAAIADETFSHILSYIKPGVAERDIAVEMEYKMKKLGAEGLAFDIIIASGVRSAMPHGVASDKQIAAGELVTLDFGAIYQGYCSDMTRTVMVGEPSAQQREIYAIVLEAEKRGVAATRAGINGKELDEVCRGYIREHGYAEAFGHSTGHGVGRYIHEGPKLSVRGETDLLKPGMVVTIEPGIYLSGWGGVRIEDMVLVQENGCESFSKSPRELKIL
ncbi:MAG: Xaa-Pro dipeptidase [Firmicutes bacterium]|nr:Xaa-Pro dipeptidase [Bacillota bacterium]